MEAAAGMLGAVTTTEFIEIAMQAMRLNIMVDFDLYFTPKSPDEHVLYREKNLPFTQETRERLSEHGVSSLFVHQSEERQFRRYIEDNLGSILDDPSVPSEEKAELLYGSLVNLVGEVMEDPRAGDVVPRSKAIVDNTCKFLYQQRGSLVYMMRVCSFDYYTYTHSINVFVFAMALAQRVLDPSDLQGHFGMGALLHDVGKSLIPPEVLNCKGRLTEEQFAIMKMHPVYGWEMLREKPDIGPVALDMVRHHHERIEGGGYPDGLSNGDISREVRILTIADIFDALTTRRSYKEALDTFKALRIMREEMMHQIDMDLFMRFIKMMGAPADNPVLTET
jgi:HD-GYP domain-containing protein (c-di-GMP phosphodiesterase class II)